MASTTLTTLAENIPPFSPSYLWAMLAPSVALTTLITLAENIPAFSPSSHRARPAHYVALTTLTALVEVVPAYSPSYLWAIRVVESKILTCLR